MVSILQTNQHEHQYNYIESIETFNSHKAEIGDFLLTITLSPDMYNMKVRQQYIKTIDIVIQVLKQYTDKYVIVPELTKKNNIHYHIVFKARASSQFVSESITDTIKGLPKLGNTYINPCIVTIQERDRVNNYLLKDYVKTFYLINSIKELSKYITAIKGWKRPINIKLNTKAKPIATYSNISNNSNESDTGRFILSFE